MTMFTHLLLDRLGERRSSSDELDECRRGDGGERGLRPDGVGGLMRVTNCSGRPSPTETGVSPSCAIRNEPNLSRTMLPLRTGWKYINVSLAMAPTRIYSYWGSANTQYTSEMVRTRKTFLQIKKYNKYKKIQMFTISGDRTRYCQGNPPLASSATVLNCKLSHTGACDEC